MIIPYEKKLAEIKKLIEEKCRELSELKGTCDLVRSQEASARKQKDAYEHQAAVLYDNILQYSRHIKNQEGYIADKQKEHDANAEKLRGIIQNLEYQSAEKREHAKGIEQMREKHEQYVNVISNQEDHIRENEKKIADQKREMEETVLAARESMRISRDMYRAAEEKQKEVEKTKEDLLKVHDNQVAYRQQLTKAAISLQNASR